MNFANKSKGIKKTSDAQPFVKCKFCDREFNSVRAMGGHISKQHKGMSQSYIERQKIRDAREPARKIQQAAKEIYLKYYKSEKKSK